MCKLTAKGYEMEDGTFYPIDKPLDISSVSPHHIADLNNNSTTQWESLILTQKFLSIEGKLDELIANHGMGCPLNPDAIRVIVKDEIKKEPGRQFSKAKKFIIAVSIFLVVALQIITLWEKIH